MSSVLGSDILCRRCAVYTSLFASAIFICQFDYTPVISFKCIFRLCVFVILVSLQYPKEIEKLEYNPNFAVRGLHYDIQKGLLLKVDSFMQIQLGCVYRGLTQLSDEEVLQLYGSRKIPVNYIENQAVNKHEYVILILLISSSLVTLFSLYLMNCFMAGHPTWFSWRIYFLCRR